MYTVQASWNIYPQDAFIQKELSSWGGLLPYMGYIGMCRCEGYSFQAVYSRIGYINQSVWVQNRVSFFRKLISSLKILSRLGKQLLQDRGIWGVYSSIGQHNSAELALLQVKGSRVPLAHPHPEIPKVPPPPLGLSSYLRGKPYNSCIQE